MHLNDSALHETAQRAARTAALDAIGKEGHEIERKCLLCKLPEEMPAATVLEIEQGYLP
jgi:hypothetical protein